MYLRNLTSRPGWASSSSASSRPSSASPVMAAFSPAIARSLIQNTNIINTQNCHVLDMRPETPVACATGMSGVKNKLLEIPDRSWSLWVGIIHSKRPSILPVVWSLPEQLLRQPPPLLAQPLLAVRLKHEGIHRHREPACHQNGTRSPSLPLLGCIGCQDRSPCTLLVC